MRAVRAFESQQRREDWASKICVFAPLRDSFFDGGFVASGSWENGRQMWKLGRPRSWRMY
ncbi:MAG: hypothetical protein ACI93T_002317 [Porticoccaceae bacterium]|jgi:hypothetical protein